MVRLFACGRCFRAHIEKKKSKCDYHFNRALSTDEIKSLENTVNDVISQDLPITSKETNLADASSKFNLGRLPEGAKSVRIVSIGGYDHCPCIGQHVLSTKEIGKFRVISADFANEVLRIRYKLDQYE
jgi:misacylated tRNA(Ala) deacylase